MYYYVQLLCYIMHIWIYNYIIMHRSI